MYPSYRGARLLQDLKDVPIGVKQGGYPTAPVFLLRRPYELDSLSDEPVIFIENVCHGEADHYPVGITRLPFYAVVKSDVEADVAKDEINEVVMVPVDFEADNVSIELQQPVDVLGPDGDSRYAFDH